MNSAIPRMNVPYSFRFSFMIFFSYFHSSILLQHKTIDSVLERGERLDSLVEKSSDLSAASQVSHLIIIFVKFIFLSNFGFLMLHESRKHTQMTMFVSSEFGVFVIFLWVIIFVPRICAFVSKCVLFENLLLLLMSC